MKPVEVSKSQPAPWRAALRWGGVGLVAVAFVVFSTIPSDLIPPYHGIALALIGLMALGLAGRGKQTYYSPVLLAILFVLGYPLRMVVQVISGHDFQDAVGQFGFSSDEWTTVVVIASCGVFGLLVGQAVAGQIVARSTRVYAGETYQPSARHVAQWAIGWFAASMGLNLLMWWLGVGQTGISQETELPYRLGGVMSYMRTFVVPITGLPIVEAALRAKSRVLTRRMLIFIVTEAMVFGFLALSKAVVVRLGPLVFLLLIGNGDQKRSRRLGYLVLLVLAAVVLVLLPVLVAVRGLVFEEGGYVSADRYVADLRASVTLERWSAGIVPVLLLPVERSIGLAGTMAVSSHPEHSVELLLRALASQDEYFARYFWDSVLGMGSSTQFGNLVYRGLGTGLFGLLYLSGSMWVVFVGAVICAAGLVAMEYTATRLVGGGMASMGCTIGFILGLKVWEAVFFDFHYALIFVGAAVLLCRFFVTGKAFELRAAAARAPVQTGH